MGAVARSQHTDVVVDDPRSRSWRAALGLPRRTRPDADAHRNRYDVGHSGLPTRPPGVLSGGPRLPRRRGARAGPHGAPRHAAARGDCPGDRHRADRGNWAADPALGERGRPAVFADRNHRRAHRCRQCHASDAHLGDSLAAARATPGAAQPPPSPDVAAPRPWPIVVLSGFGALMASIPFIAGFAVLLGNFLEKGAGTYVIALIVLPVAIWGLRTARNLFVEQ